MSHYIFQAIEEMRKLTLPGDEIPTYQEVREQWDLRTNDNDFDKIYVINIITGNEIQIKSSFGYTFVGWKIIWSEIFDYLMGDSHDMHISKCDE